MVRKMNFGIIHFAIAFSITYIVTRDEWISGTVSLLAPLLHVASYLLHDKLWTKLNRRRHDCANCPGPQHCALLHKDARA